MGWVILTCELLEWVSLAQQSALPAGAGLIKWEKDPYPGAAPGLLKSEEPFASIRSGLGMLRLPVLGCTSPRSELNEILLSLKRERLKVSFKHFFMRIQRCLKSVILSIQAQHCQLVVGVGCPLCSVLRDLTSSTECSWGATLQGGHETIREHPKENCKDGEGLAGKGCEERLRLCSAQSRGAEGRPRGGCSSSQGAEGSAELCSVW